MKRSCNGSEQIGKEVEENKSQLFPIKLCINAKVVMLCLLVSAIAGTFIFTVRTEDVGALSTTKGGLATNYLATNYFGEINQTPTFVWLYTGDGAPKTDQEKETVKLLGRQMTDYDERISLPKLIDKAVAAVKLEGRQVPPIAEVHVNVVLSTGCLKVLFYSRGRDWFYVTFNFNGDIVRLAGARGAHGEDGWVGIHTNANTGKRKTKSK